MFLLSRTNIQIYPNFKFLDKFGYFCISSIYPKIFLHTMIIIVVINEYN